MVKIVAVCGSLRKGSFNRKLLNNIVEKLKDLGADVDIAEIKDIRLYDGDVELKGIPKPVDDFKNKLKNADGVLFVSPEYNGSITGVLKNALDWASRPPNEIKNVFGGKVAILAGASPGGMATAKAQLTTALILKKLGMIVSPKEMLLAGALGAFDEDGKLTKDMERVDVVSEYFFELTKKLSQ